MIGEYILYYKGKIVGGISIIYCWLNGIYATGSVKNTKSQLPDEGAKKYCYQIPSLQ
jgi:hypothetical protein